MKSPNITTYEGYGERMVDDFRNGQGLHGGSLHNLLESSPDIAVSVLDRTLGEKGVIPGSVEELADILKWNTPEDKARFIKKFTPSENI